MREKTKDLPRAGGIYLDYDLMNSKAYEELTRIEITVFNAFYLKRQIVGKKDAKKMKIRPRTILNNGKIIFTYSEAVKYGMNKGSFGRAVDKLLKVGFIEIAQKPTYHKQPTLYSISYKWREYGKSGYEPSIRKKNLKGTSIGNQTRFQKKKE